MANAKLKSRILRYFAMRIYNIISALWNYKAEMI